MSTETFSISVALASNAQNTMTGWVELIPAGQRIVGRDGRQWENTSPESIVNAFAKNNADLPIDLEHSSEHKASKGEPAPAVGWVKALQSREGGAIWGLVEWTQKGKKLIDEKAYRYLSPVFAFNRANNQILQLYSAGLTNQPNLHLTALNQRENSTKEDKKMSKEIHAALGLPEGATTAQAINAINQLKDDKDKALNSASNPSLEKFVPRADHDVALNRAEKAENKLKDHEEAAMNQQIETELENASKAGKITPATLEYHRACCKQEGGLERFCEYVKSAPEMCGDSGLDKKTINQNDKGLSNEDKAACSLLGLDENDYLKAKEAA